MAPETADYRLSCELRGHEDDVSNLLPSLSLHFPLFSRSTIFGLIVTNSRLGSWHLYLWRFRIRDVLQGQDGEVLGPGPGQEAPVRSVEDSCGHSSFVGPLAWIPLGDRFPEGGIVSGGMDTQVLLWDLSKGELMETMKGHQVTGLAVDDNGDIISSSIDCTIRRWRKGHAIEFWEAHKVSVQAVKQL